MWDLNKTFVMSKFSKKEDLYKAKAEYFYNIAKEQEQAIDRAWHIVHKSDFYSREDVLAILEGKEPEE